jgi:hypothetical protein
MSLVGKWMELEIVMLSQDKPRSKGQISSSPSTVDPTPKIMIMIAILGYECICGAFWGNH